MKKVDLLYYFNLAQSLGALRRVLFTDQLKAGTVYQLLKELRTHLEQFSSKAEGFNTCRHTVKAVLTEAERLMREEFRNKEGIFQFDLVVEPWRLLDLSKALDAFQAVFTAESTDQEIYSVEQVSIYKMDALASKSSDRFPEEYKHVIPDAALLEFDNAGKCLAFNLPTASGFHALRGVELCILAYLERREVNVDKLKTWHQYCQAIEKLEGLGVHPYKPSLKVAAMVSRMKDLDRNPLMHPQDTLDIGGADQLFNLSSITVIELAKDDLQLEKALKSVSKPFPPKPTKQLAAPSRTHTADKPPSRLTETPTHD
jgi:hypothetical protein